MTDPEIAAFRPLTSQNAFPPQHPRQTKRPPKPFDSDGLVEISGSEPTRPLDWQSRGFSVPNKKHRKYGQYGKYGRNLQLFKSQFSRLFLFSVLIQQLFNTWQFAQRDQIQLFPWHQLCCSQKFSYGSKSRWCASKKS